MKHKKTILILVLILLLLAAGGGAYWYFTQRAAASSEDAVFVQNVGDLTGTGTIPVNRYSGIIETQKTEKVTFDSNKQLDELFVAEDDHVKEGDPLFSYDTAAIELDIQSAELEIERQNQTIANDNEQIAQLEKDMNKAKDSDKPGFSAQIKELQAEVAQAEYTIKTKERDIEGLRASAENSTVFSPIEGTITSVGDPLNPTVDPNGESAFIVILADGDLRVKGTISEQNIMNIAVGLPVIIHSRIDDTVTWSGVISAIDTQAENNENNMYYDGGGEHASKYPFYIDLEDPEGLMLGQHVTIEMDYGQQEAREGLYLSSGWLLQEESGTFIWACKEGKRLEKRKLELGEYDADLDEWQILSGLSADDYIAWPDESCREGAATTTEYVFDEDEMTDFTDPENMGGEEYYEEGGYEEGGYEEGGFEEEMPEEPYVEEVPEG